MLFDFKGPLLDVIDLFLLIIEKNKVFVVLLTLIL